MAYNNSKNAGRNLEVKLTYGDIVVCCHISRGVLSHVSLLRAFLPAGCCHMLPLRSTVRCHRSTYGVRSHVVCSQMSSRNMVSHVCPRRAATCFPAACCPPRSAVTWYPCGPLFAVTTLRTPCGHMLPLRSVFNCPPAVCCHMSARGMLSHVSLLPLFKLLSLLSLFCVLS